jgi:glucan phosphoethanolaminetransferase (alkaline phosphatase superfamily)
MKTHWSPRIAAAEFAGFGAAWVGVALLEATNLAIDTPARGAMVFWACWRVTLLWTFELLAPVWVFSLILGATALLSRVLPPKRASMNRRVHVGVVAAASVSLAVWIHLTLGSYAEFLWYPPFLVAAVVAAFALWLGHVDPLTREGETARRRRIPSAAWTLVGLGGFAVGYFANRTLFVGQYPTLHLSILLWTCAFLQLFFFSVFLHRVRRRHVKLVAVAVGVVTALALPTTLASKELLDKVTTSAASSSTLSEARLVGYRYNPSVEDVLAAPLEPEPNAAALFAEMSNLPPLPDSFRLEDYNVLLVTSEATRYDQTSLHDPSLGTTPNLAAFVREDAAFSFGRAFAPSSGTLHSISSLLCMTFPSMIALETWGKAWHGALRSDEETVVELFAQAGYDTFLVSHDHKHAFQSKIVGFDQGFSSKTYVYESGGRDSVDTDAQIADKAVAEIHKRASAERRFFGWIFFASPHSDYFAHYADMARKTDVERYRQEIRFMDVQLGRIVSALREEALLDRTVVIYAGDHGEEFQEHGGSHHKTTVYSESTRVPFVVRVPGFSGELIDAPTSLMYVFPWLALPGPKPLANAAQIRLSDEIGPMMRATHGAVVIELIGHDRMRSSLVYDSRKINFDFISKEIELFDPLSDPLERFELLRQRPELEAGARADIVSYMRVRAARRRFVLVPSNHH